MQHLVNADDVPSEDDFDFGAQYSIRRVATAEDIYGRVLKDIAWMDADEGVCKLCVNM